MKHVSEREAIEDLANEIILSSVKEYRSALMHLQKDPESVAARRIVQREERFYYSDWFAVLTNLEPSFLIRKMKEMIAERGGAECTSAGISLTNVREP